jgi:uncharacterized protein YcbX
MAAAGAAVRMDVGNVAHDAWFAQELAREERLPLIPADAAARRIQQEEDAAAVRRLQPMDQDEDMGDTGEAPAAAAAAAPAYARINNNNAAMPRLNRQPSENEEMEALPPNAVALLLFLPSESASDWHHLQAVATAAVHREQPPGHVVVVHDGYVVLRRAHASSAADPV